LINCKVMHVLIGINESEYVLKWKTESKGAKNK
jgi:hypothetical protein